MTANVTGSRPTAVSALAQPPLTPFERELQVAITQSARGEKGKPVSKAVSDAARQFMVQNKLMGKETDGEVGLGVRAQWKAVKEITVGDKSFIVMARALETQIEGKWIAAGSDVQEVVEIKRANGKPQFRTFEQAVQIPKDGVLIGIGSPQGPDNEMYYGRAKGKDAVAALKSIYGATPFAGASFTVKKGAKAPFDPTPGRKWSVSEMHFSMRRGMTAEIYDGRPSQLDDDFDGYFHSTNGKFAPWDFSRVKAVQVGGSWMKALPKRDIEPPFS